MDRPLGGLLRHEHGTPADRDRRHRPDEGVRRTTASIPNGAPARCARARPFGDLPVEVQESRLPADGQRLGRVRPTAFGSHRAARRYRLSCASRRRGGSLFGDVVRCPRGCNTTRLPHPLGIDRRSRARHPLRGGKPRDITRIARAARRVDQRLLGGRHDIDNRIRVTMEVRHAARIQRRRRPVPVGRR